MDAVESFDNSPCAGQIKLAERELASFIGAVKELFGPDQALLSALDWLHEHESMDSRPRSIHGDWRAVTIAASARLATRLTPAHDQRALGGSSEPTKPPMPMADRCPCASPP